MGYRLNASIPNIEYVDNNLELGKQYNREDKELVKLFKQIKEKENEFFD